MGHVWDIPHVFGWFLMYKKENRILPCNPNLCNKFNKLGLRWAKKDDSLIAVFLVDGTRGRT